MGVDCGCGLFIVTCILVGLFGLWFIYVCCICFAGLLVWVYVNSVGCSVSLLLLFLVV